jgi:hypothetical protein
MEWDLKNSSKLNKSQKWQGSPLLSGANLGCVDAFSSRRMADSALEQKLHGNRSYILGICGCIVCLFLGDIENGGCDRFRFPCRSREKHGNEAWHQKRHEQDLENRKDQRPGSSKLL